MQEIPIYMDNNSTTRVDPRVVEKMMPFFSEHFGNASSLTHSYGNKAADAVEVARNQVAKLLHAQAKEIIFTSGATESNNLALKGVMRAAPTGSHVVINAAEHKAVIDPVEQLREEGFEVSVLPVDRYGMVTPASISGATRPNTVLVSVMWANNEVGTINPIREIAELCNSKRVLFHTDATQAAGKIPIDLTTIPADLLSLSAHKMYGPKGIGALYVRMDGRRFKVKPLIDGGGHERRLRSGTLPVQQIVGLGEACSLSQQAMTDESIVLVQLRNRLRNGLQESISHISVNGHLEQRLPGSLHVTFDGVNSEALMTKLKDVVAVSTGSACTTADPEPSHVLLGMGLGEDQISCSIRFGLGRFNSIDEIDVLIPKIAEAVTHLRQLSPL